MTTLVLALAPAGIAEMALTGKMLGLDAALITGFQIVRIVMTMGLAAWTARWFERWVEKWGWLARDTPAGERIGLLPPPCGGGLGRGVPVRA